jgi:hypothetical protein
MAATTAQQQPNESDPFKHMAVPHVPLRPASKSEAACIEMLEKYTPYKAIQGVTFQVPIGKRSVDFFIIDTMVEFHPLILGRTFTSYHAYNQMMISLRDLPKHKKQSVLKILQHEFEYTYYRERRAILDGDPKYRGTNLVVVYDNEQFCTKVLQRFGSHNLPSLDKLKREFKKIVRHSYKRYGS